MSRIKMVTRTIESTEITALCMDILNAEPCNKTITLSGTFKDNKAIEKAARKEIDTEIFKFVSLVNVEKKEALYGMTEQEFLSYAKVLPPRTSAEN